MSCFPKETTHTMNTSVVSTLIRGSMRWTNVSCLEIASMVPMSKKVDSMLDMWFLSSFEENADQDQGDQGQSASQDAGEARPGVHGRPRISCSLFLLRFFETRSQAEKTSFPEALQASRRGPSWAARFLPCRCCGKWTIPGRPGGLKQTRR